MEGCPLRPEKRPLPQCAKRGRRFSAARLHQQPLRTAGHRFPAMITRRDFLKLAAGGLFLPSDASAVEETDWRKILFVMDTWFWQAPRELDVPAQVRLIKN